MLCTSRSVLWITLCVVLAWLDVVTPDVTASESEEFVDKHNELRRQVSPAAANMKKMRWDNALASMAQEWASRCAWEHGHPSGFTTDYSYVGQNLWAGTGGYDVSNAVQLWYDEVGDYSYRSNSCSPGAVCGHYTQVVWAASYAVGCGIHECRSGLSKTNLGGGTRTVYIIVCNYGPGGNYEGQKPYVSGNSCSRCTDEGFTLCEDGLCSGEGTEGGVFSAAIKYTAHHYMLAIITTSVLIYSDTLRDIL